MLCLKLSMAPYRYGMAQGRELKLTALNRREGLCVGGMIVHNEAIGSNALASAHMVPNSPLQKNSETDDG